jgi:integrase/recombinase XerD
MSRNNASALLNQSADATASSIRIEIKPACPMVLEKIFIKPSARFKQFQAPLLKEREEYLQHQSSLGRSRGTLQNIAVDLLHIVRVMQLTDLRPTTETEIREAGGRWAQEVHVLRTKRGSKSSAQRFILAARGWFRFNGCLTKPRNPCGYFEKELGDFLSALRFDVGLFPYTVAKYGQRVRQFLLWLSVHRDDLSLVSVNEVEEFLESKRALHWKPRSTAAQCVALRAFFRYAEARGWCRRNLSYSILNPAIRRDNLGPGGPSWKDVRRLVDSVNGTEVTDYRAKAVLLLCSVYGLRNREVVGLCLRDFDWQNETFIVRRAKSGRIQRFPIQYEVGQAIIQYLKEARPMSAFRELFLTHQTPFRPLTTVGPIVTRRIKQLGIESRNLGPHCLRHACATELLRRGTSLQSIAEFLGHRNLDTISIYAKYDLRALRKISAFSLSEVQ